jgi:hypothetical protein
MHDGIKLLGVYIGVTVVVQAIAFVLSLAVDKAFPDLSFIAFLVVCLGSFVVSWPVAVWLTEPKAPAVNAAEVPVPAGKA